MSFKNIYYWRSSHIWQTGRECVSSVFFVKLADAGSLEVLCSTLTHGIGIPMNRIQISKAKLSHLASLGTHSYKVS